MPTAKLILESPTDAGREIPIEASITIGRAPGNDLVLNDPAVSREHARVERYDDGSFLLMDLGSSNGTRLNDRTLEAPARLRSGDVATIGPASLTFVLEGEDKRSVEDEVPEDERTVTTKQRVPARSMIGQSPAMRHVFHLIDVAAKSPIPVLVDGETGTGKELVARAVHDASDRAGKPFLALNCATLVESLLASELFGHRRGAFTGADRDHAGLFESASGGTVFLDEVGEMPGSTQPKLLRVLEENEVVRVGESRPRAVDVRVISATNRDLNLEVEQGRFRNDLFFRLSTFPIRLPPLRERESDSPLLVRHAIQLAAHKHGKRVPGATDAASAVLERYDWPGNVRELRNEMQRAVALVRDGELIDVRHLSDRVRQGPGGTAGATDAGRQTIDLGSAPPQPPSGGGDTADLREARAVWEAEHIVRVLEENNGHIGKTAEALGLSRTALYKKFKEYGIQH